MNLKWYPNTEANLTGYRVYCCSDSSSALVYGSNAFQAGSPINVENHLNVIFSGLDLIYLYYFAATTYDIDNLESGYSNFVSILEKISPLVSSFAMQVAAKSRTIPVTAPTTTENNAVVGVLDEAGNVSAPRSANVSV